MTLGTLRFRLSKAFPGVDPELIDGWIADVYGDILAVLPWSRTLVHSVLQTTPTYTTGAVSVENGSADVELTGGTWSSEMTGRTFRVTPRDDIYEFTYASPTTATLDRPYQGADAAEAGYAIFQTVYPLPADARLVPDDAFGTFGAWWSKGPVERSTRAEIRALGIGFLGASSSADGWGPFRWATYMDDGSTPPRMQIELYPAPAAGVGIPFTYYAEAPAIGKNTNQILALWMQPSALIEGTTARIKRHLKDYLGANTHETQFQKSISLMIGEEARRIGGVTMTLGSHYTRHRHKRASR